MLNELKERLSDKGIKVKVSNEVKELLIKKGWDTRYGARPLRRVIQKDIEDVLSTMIIKNEIADNSTAVINLEEEQIVVYQE